MISREVSRNKDRITFPVERPVLLKAYELMCTARSMALLYEENRSLCSRYVHSTSHGHEAIQLAMGLQLTEHDYASLYYRDESTLLGIGLTPYELMLQLLAKRDDPFSGGRSYYSHPALNRNGMPTVPHQSSATGMQAIPATGMAQGIAYLENRGLLKRESKSIVICSMGDGAVTEGEVAEAFQMAVLKQLPIIYLIQDNEWGISATAQEMRAMNAFEYSAGFKGLERLSTDGLDFIESYLVVKKAISYVRSTRSPILVHARCSLLGHHTSGVRREWYRADVKEDVLHDPLIILENYLLKHDEPATSLAHIRLRATRLVAADFKKALDAPEPDEVDFNAYEFAPTPVIKENGIRSPANATKITMVDAALHAVDDILKKHPEALLYGQDVGRRLGGVFREAATLADKYGDDRVFNTPIQEAYIVGSTAGMATVGAKPIVEIQFADYVWPAINQLVTELSKSCYLTKGQFPIQSLIRIPIGAYGGGGPYHSGSIESVLLSIRGIKVVYPSNAADMKGLLKASFYDPNPVIMLEHKGLYWAKVPGTSDSKSIEPDEDYVIPLGKANILQHALEEHVEAGNSALIITYGMGIYWSNEAAKNFDRRIEIMDLRTLNPIDWESITTSVKKHSRVLIVTEEPLLNSFAESLAGRIAQHCFKDLDAPVLTVGAADLPAIPLNIALEKMMLPNALKVEKALRDLLMY